MRKVQLFGDEQVATERPYAVAIAAEVLEQSHAAAFIATSGNWGLVGSRMSAESDPCASDNPQSCIEAATLRALRYALNRAPSEGPIRIETTSPGVAQTISMWLECGEGMPTWYNTERTDGDQTSLHRLRRHLLELSGRITVVYYEGAEAGPLSDAALILSSVTLQRLQFLINEERARKDASAVAQEALHSM